MSKKRVRDHWWVVRDREDGCVLEFCVTRDEARMSARMWSRKASLPLAWLEIRKVVLR